MSRSSSRLATSFASSLCRLLLSSLLCEFTCAHSYHVAVRLLVASGRCITSCTFFSLQTSHIFLAVLLLFFFVRLKITLNSATLCVGFTRVCYFKMQKWSNSNFISENFQPRLRQSAARNFNNMNYKLKVFPRVQAWQRQTGWASESDGGAGAEKITVLEPVFSAATRHISESKDISLVLGFFESR